MFCVKINCCKELQVYHIDSLKMFLCVRKKSEDVFPPDVHGKPTMNEDVSQILKIK